MPCQQLASQPASHPVEAQARLGQLIQPQAQAQVRAQTQPASNKKTTSRYQPSPKPPTSSPQNATRRQPASQRIALFFCEKNGLGQKWQKNGGRKKYPNWYGIAFAAPVWGPPGGPPFWPNTKNNVRQIRHQKRGRAHFENVTFSAM